ncbi:GNAT family N-acetyltransferase [Streptomyces sp. NPDC005573]|uniref:GNAT family N-acetyltransferase n=1 Tax=Streptomyces sp. NPDC005573 TaxID=3156890 RepID=UPI0033A9EB21
MILRPLPRGGALPAPLLAELTALYASQAEFHALSGDFPDPSDIRPEQVEAALAGELAHPDAEVLLAHVRDPGQAPATDAPPGERLVALAVTLAHHPDPADPDPWIGLLMVGAAEQRRGYGRTVATLVEDRFRAAGRDAVRLAVLDGNTRGTAFWTALGYRAVAHRPDRALGRPCTVLRKPLRAPGTDL